MSQTYRTTADVECCVTCGKPVGNYTPSEALYAAAKRALKYLDATRTGRHFGGDHEDIFAARELSEAIQAVEQAQAEAQTRERLLVQS